MISRRAILRGATWGLPSGLSAGLLGWGQGVRRLRAEPPGPAAVVQGFYDVLLAVMKDGGKLGFRGRYARLDPAIQAALDLPLMTRLAVGPQWPSLTPQQQSGLTEAFSRFSVATYANRFGDYSGERFVVEASPVQANERVVVDTRLIKRNGEVINLNYLMHQRDQGGWRIIDVFLGGTVSELATRRAEFSSVLRRSGPDALMELLQRKTADLGAS